MFNAKTRIAGNLSSPTAVAARHINLASPSPTSTFKNPTLFPRSFRKDAITVERNEGHYIITKDGPKIYDASGGAGVSIFGPGPKERVITAIREQEDRFGGYVCGTSFSTDISMELADALVQSTNGHMESCCFYGSGSASTEAAAKLCLQYHAERNQPNRRLFVAREQSYHGTTWAALSMGSYQSRRKPYDDILMDVHHVQACNSYRGKNPGESDQEYVYRLKEELRQKFLDLGPENVAGFFVEPVVGAALGCMQALPGYLKAMQEVCQHYDILFILDEIMCGWGRCGTLHAWQDEGVVPDIQTLGKGLAGGYEEISAVLIGKRMKIVDAIRNGTGYFNHGHTFQAMPKACAAVFATMPMVQELLPNVRKMGALLMKRLKVRFAGHANVGDIRGKGLFLALEFVRDLLTKTPFEPTDKVSTKIHEMGLTHPFLIHVYPGSGSADPHGEAGDHIIIAPPYDITEEEVNLIVDRVGTLVEHFFENSESTTQ